MATNILNNVIHRNKELRNDDAFKRLLKITDEFAENSVVDFLPLVSSRPKCVPRKSGVYYFKININYFTFIKKLCLF